MPHELAGLMIRNPEDGIKPSVLPFSLSGTTGLSEAILGTIEELYPDDMTDDGEHALLTPEQAIVILTTLQTQAESGQLNLLDDCLEQIPDLIQHARDGHWMTIYSE